MVDAHKLALATSTEPMTLAVCAKMLAAILSPNLSEGSRLEDFQGGFLGHSHSIQNLQFFVPEKK